jgi:hypothetical protein
MFRATLDNDLKVHRRFYDPNHSAPAAVTGLAVSVTTEDGTVLAAPAIVDETGTHGAGIYTAQLTAAALHTSSLQTLDLVWTGTIAGDAMKRTQQIEVVADRYFELGELRLMDGIGSSTKFTTELLEVARAETESLIEDYTKTSFVARHEQDTFDACEYDTTYGIFLRNRPVQALSAVTINAVAATLSEWAVKPTGQARTTSFSATQDGLGAELVIDYTHGYDATPPDLKRAALRYARHLVLTNRSTVPDRSRLMQTEFGLFVLDHPGDTKATGLPEVDATLNRYCEVSPGSFA